MFLHRRREVGHVSHIVHDDDSARAEFRNAGQAIDFGEVTNFIRNQDVLIPPRAKTSASATF